MDDINIFGSIRLLVLDVDGTMTDGHIYVSGSGEIMKAFHVRDGYAIKHMLPEAAIKTAIVTGRESEIVSVRARELDIEYVYQNISDKAAALSEIKQKLGLDWSEIAFMGDDENDLPAMRLAGLTACPADAVPEVKKQCTYICVQDGGKGAVREFIEWLVKSKG